MWDGRGLCGRDLRCLPVGASGPVRPCGATLPTAWAPSREAADGYTVPKAPAGYALINVIDLVSRNMKIISMDLLIVPQVMDLYIWQFLVPDKRFKSHKLRQFDGFVPRKRFIRYQLPRIAIFVPQKRFNWDKRHYFHEIDDMSLELHSNIKHQPGPFGARLTIYNMLTIKTKQTFSTTIRN